MKEGYNAGEYTETCPMCNKTINYIEIYKDNRILSEKELISFNCPDCNYKIFPCDLCVSLNDNVCTLNCIY